ncbi:DnaD domain protein [Haloimpatiens sp. FM7315]|uniref:DnaD domain protein n=1 Tax=Haloimpatiens sp. FM7315 TaxID=3298609 RepID=UPI00370C0CC9
MATFRKFYIKFWIEEKVLELTPAEKFMYIFLRTSTETSQCGVYKMPEKLMCLETGYDSETIYKLTDSLEKKGFIKFSRKTSEIMILDWVKKNFVNSPNTIKCMNKELREIENKDFIISLYEICENLGYPVNYIFSGIQATAEKCGKILKEEPYEATAKTALDTYSKNALDTYSKIATEDFEKNFTESSNENSRENSSENSSEKPNENFEENSFEHLTETSIQSDNTEFKELINVFSNNIHPITSIEYERLKDWCSDIEPSAIIIAIKEAASHSARNISYINSILNNWLSMGINTKKQVEEYMKNWKSTKSKDKASKIDSNKIDVTKFNADVYREF